MSTASSPSCPPPDSRKLRERPLQRIATPGGTNGLNTDEGEPADERRAHGGSGKTHGGRPSKPGPVSRSIGTTWQPVHRRDSLSTGHSSAGSGHGRNFAYHNAGGSKELDGCRMARNRSESSIPCN